MDLVAMLPTLVGLALGAPSPTTPFLVALVLRHFGGGTSSAIMTMGFLAALLLNVTRLLMIPPSCIAVFPGWRPTGYTSRTTGGATAASLYETRGPPNVDVSTIAMLTVQSCPGPRPLLRISSSTLPPLRRHAAQFGGGLVVLCSRLGRRARRAMSLGAPPNLPRQFEGTVLRCLGPHLNAPLLNVVDKKTTSLPGTRTCLFPWPIMPSALPCVLDAAVPRRNLELPAAWPLSASAWLLASLLLPPVPVIRGCQLGRGALPSRRPCMGTAATRALANRRPPMPPRGTRSMRFPMGATTSLVV